MPDRWNDPRDDRWRREARYRQEHYGRDERSDADGNPDYLTGPLEGRSFRDHEHDADWDGAYNQGAYEDRYDAGGPRGPGRYDRGPAYRERDYSGRAETRRVGGYTRSPPYGGARAAGGQTYRDYGGYVEQEPRGPRPGQYANFGFGHDINPAARREDPRERDRRDEGRGFLDRAADRVASWFGSEGEHRPGAAWQGHRGKGPRGYRRSDQRISDDVHDALTDDPYLDATEVSVTVASCEVTLTGVVADREAKHRAERIVERVSGVDHVQNNLRIGQVQGTKPFTGGNPLTTPGRGFGDSVLEAQAKGETPRSIDEDRH
jgi:osmotically-inducible protein OsmY